MGFSLEGSASALPKNLCTLEDVTSNLDNLL